MQRSNTISQRRAAYLIPNKKAFHTALVRNKFMVPPLKDPLVTVAFMKGVLNGRYFLLKQEQVEHTRQCADKPPKGELADLVADVLLNCPNLPAEVAAAVRSTAHLIRRKKPNVDWQLQMLAQFAPDHAIF